MTGLAEKLVRPEIMQLAPYQTAYDENDRERSIKLDANENPYPSLIDDPVAKNTNRYPEPQPKSLLARLSDLYGLPAESIFVGRGADEAIDLLVRAFCRPADDAVLICPPTFAYYETVARIQGARVLEVPLSDGFHLDTETILETAKSDSSLKIIFLCSPMNPTGNSIPRDKVLEICRQLPDVFIVVDEAYVEFSSQQSLADQITAYENLIVLRTLSKSYGLAGARCGSALAHPGVISILGRIMPPYPLSSVTINTVHEALSPFRMPLVQTRVSEILAQRDRLLSLLPRAADIDHVFPSDSNAIFVQVSDPELFQQKMDQAAIRVRRRENALAGGFRITVGTPKENTSLLTALGLEQPPETNRMSEAIRQTKETAISCRIDLDAPEQAVISTGVGFFDHMLEQIARHGGFSLQLTCQGDLEIDAHHTLEDCMLTLGECLKNALGDKRGIGRFGFLLPMDETEAQVSLDLGGRPFSVFNGDFKASHIGEYPTEMTPHLFRSLADSLGAAIHISVTGENDHHKTEACFKALGRALRMAIRREGDDIPSTKGIL